MTGYWLLVDFLGKASEFRLSFIRLEGTAKRIPSLYIVIPINSPSSFTNGLPEFSGERETLNLISVIALFSFEEPALVLVAVVLVAV